MDECTGKSPIVRVQFSSKHEFTFSCCTVRMNGKGEIKLRRDPEHSSWTFVSVNDLTDPPFTWSLTENGASITIKNDHSNPGKNASYTVTISDGGTAYTSKKECDGRTRPPMIMNL